MNKELANELLEYIQFSTEFNIKVSKMLVEYLEQEDKDKNNKKEKQE